MTFTTAALIAAWGAIALLALALAGTLQQLRALRAAQDGSSPLGPPIGAPAPALETQRDAAGPALVLFAAAGCPACQRVIPAFGDLDVAARKVIVHRDEPTMQARDGVFEVVGGGDAFARWNVTVTPFCVAVGADGRVVAAAAVGAPEALAPVAASIEPRSTVARTV